MPRLALALLAVLAPPALARAQNIQLSVDASEVARKVIHVREVIPVQPGAVALHYATLHFLVTPAVLAWLFFRRPTRYRAGSAVLMITTALALTFIVLLAEERYALGPNYDQMITTEQAVDQEESP